MKVLHINCNYTGNHVHRNMIEALSEIKEIDNKVYVPVYKDIDEKFNDNVTISKCFRKIDRVLFYKKTRQIQTDIFKKYDFSNIDIVHAYTLFTDGNIAYEIKKRYNIPYVVAVRNTDINLFFRYRPYLKKLGMNILKNADAVFFLSPKYKEKLEEKYIKGTNIDNWDKKTFIIPNGIDNFWIEKRYINKVKAIDRDIKVIYAGRIDKNKNIESTQKALQLLKKENYNVEFTIIGKIADKSIYKKIMKYNNTKHYNNMPKEELITKYRENDIFIMPSFTETFGMVYIEAMSQGLPVIYTVNQGFDKQFQEGIVGYHVIPNNYKDIADRIIDILSNYNTISNNCINKVQNFKWERICYIYYNIYQEIIKK